MTDTALDLVFRVAEELENAPLPDNQVRLTNGVILEISGISAETYNAIIRKTAEREPAVPVVEIKSKGRKEPNPNDPEYIQRFKRWQAEQSSALLLAVYVFGVRVVYVPVDVAGPDDTETLNDLRLSGLLEYDTPNGRKVAWLQHCALSHNAQEQAGEQRAIFFAAGRAMGVNNADVSEAAKRPERLS